MSAQVHHVRPVHHVQVYHRDARDARASCASRVSHAFYDASRVSHAFYDASRVSHAFYDASRVSAFMSFTCL